MFEVITIEDRVGQSLSKLSVDELIEISRVRKSDWAERAELEIFRRRLGALTMIHIEVARGKKRAEIVASVRTG